MGLMVSYNQFNWTNTYTGRNGATKIVILERTAFANQKIHGTFSTLSGSGGRKEWTSISNGGSATPRRTAVRKHDARRDVGMAHLPGRRGFEARGLRSPPTRVSPE